MTLARVLANADGIPPGWQPAQTGYPDVVVITGDGTQGHPAGRSRAHHPTRVARTDPPRWPDRHTLAPTTPAPTGPPSSPSTSTPDCIPARLNDTDGSVNLWLYGADTGDGESIAVAAFGDGYEPQALQAGPRDLWTEVQTAYHRWETAGKPDADRFGLTVNVDKDGGLEQRPWYGTPAREIALPK
ncbi:hypothetical protein B4N89_45360 [Embleya scabrispora]|uniref:Uncharacterized protein n=1 Tax=Embleya scabrispora TaxID=159449 RepID=A0A1T3NIU8_9ACTN|nr:hypothetical protein [Embleya scabrispora]OPC76718.1 hypothetical protein B4N89_45360 [Embleya scabrispora]